MPTNGYPPVKRVMFGVKEVLGLMVMVFGIGGGWAVMNTRVSAQDKIVSRNMIRLDDVEDTQADISKDVALVQRDVEEIKDDVNEIREGMSEQSILLRDIWAKVQAP